MEVVPLLFLGVFAALAWFGWYYSSTNVIRRNMRAMRHVAIADAREGRPARIVGRIADGPSLTAPLTGRACVFYEAIVEQHRSDGNSGSWHTIIREARGVPFVIDDGTGRARIDPEGASLAVERDSTSRSGTFDDATEIEEAFLATHGQHSKGYLFNKALRYREGALEIGEMVSVGGVGVREPDPDGAAQVSGYRDAAPTLLCLSSSPRRPLLISDYDDTKR